MNQKHSCNKNIETPASAAELLQRARALQYVQIKDLAQKLQIIPPKRAISAKGFSGQLIEKALGGCAQSLAMPDFPHLDIELKTVPVDINGLPIESTYLCIAPIQPTANMCFKESLVYQKIKHILFVPIIATCEDYQAHHIGYAFFWQPDPEILAIIEQDWREHMEQLSLGLHAHITAKSGTYLQLRPKAAHGQVRKLSLNQEGQLAFVQPKGFYLRRKFTARIFAQIFW